MNTIAVIQPYFYPYAGYFRLFAAANTVVMFDCVQFPRRGWVHRNRFALANGDLDWLTLPVAKADRDVRIDQLRFAPEPRTRLLETLPRFPALQRGLVQHQEALERMLAIETDDITAYLCERVREVAACLKIERRMVRSSSLNLAPELRGQDRVIAVVRALGGSQYVNPSGGRELYNSDAFAEAGIDLRFLSPYEGSMNSVLERLLGETTDAISAEILQQSALVT